MDDDALALDVGDVGDLQAAVGTDRDAARALVEDDRLAVLEADLVVDALRLLAQEVERAVVEDVAVLIDLDECRPFVLGGLLSLGLYPIFSNDSVPFTSFSLFMGVALAITAFPVLARILSAYARDARRCER